MLAAATVLALAVGVTAIARHSGTPRAGNSVGPALLGANQQADRSMIPWSQVDAGWTIALWTPTTLTSEQATATARPESVFLVNPIGGRYLVTTLTGDFRLKLADWSTDVRQALLIRQGEASSEVLRLDLASGLTQSFTTAGRVRLAKFTKPAGTSILLEPASGAVERVSLTGVHEITYPFSRTTDAINAYHPLSAPDGRSIVFDSDQGLVVRAEDGSPRRTIAAPSGMSACMPLRWWETGSVLASCHPAVGLITQLYVIPIGAAGPSTPLSAPTSPDYPFTLAWRLGSGVLLLNAATSCGDGGVLGRIDSTGHVVARPMPAGLGGYGLNPIGSTASTVTFEISLSCERNYAPALVSLDPGTNRVTRLLGPGLNGGSVLDAYGFGDSSYSSSFHYSALVGP